MPFRWSDYLALAQDLIRRSDEAALRSAISRAYYAVFGTAEETLAMKGIRLKRTRRRKKLNSHEAVWHTYRSDSRKNWQKIGTDGDRLKRDRVKADYKAYAAISPALASGVVARSNTVLEQLQNL
jgi:uncharacterized protein (UPF0332 family)